MSEVNFFIDNALYKNDEIPVNLERFFKKVRNGWRLRSVGIIISEKDNTTVFLPKNCDIASITENDIALLIKLLIYSSKNTHYSNIEDDLYIEMNDKFMIINELLDDLYKNGIYIGEKKETIKSNQGKINWSKSISSSKPIIIEDEIYLLNLYRDKNKKNIELLTTVHGIVMEQISNNYGRFLNGFNYTFKNKPSKPLDVDSTVTKLQLLKKLNNEHRTGHLIDLIISYFDQTRNSEDLILLTENFNLIWEMMIKSIFTHEQRYMEHLSRPYWELRDPNGEYKVKKGRNTHIPDALVVTERENHSDLDIIDAKYYDLTKTFEKNNTKLIEMESIVKQYFYEFSIDYTSSKLSSGKNYFAMPWFRVNRDDKIFSKVGKIEIDLPRFGRKRIDVLFIPTFTLMDSFLKRQKYYLE